MMSHVALVARRCECSLCSTTCPLFLNAPIPTEIDFESVGARYLTVICWDGIRYGTGKRPARE